MGYAVILISSIILSFALSPLTIRLSHRLNVFSGTKVKAKVKGKPCLGGLAIYGAFLIPSLIAHLSHISAHPKFTGLMISSTIIAIFGLMDDIRELRPFEKIAVELFAAVALIAFGIVTEIQFLPGWANILVTLAWVLFITNAFNLLDIVDGLTSGLVIIISASLFIISLINRDMFSGVILIALAGAHIGFLRHNYPPAKLYMGDTGSLFSGFLLAAIAINISYAPMDRPIAMFTPILAMSLPIYDTFFLIIMRLRNHKPIFSKTNDHFALRLVTMGYDIKKSIWIMYIFSIFLAIASIILAFSHNKAGAVVLAMAIAAFIVMGKKVGMAKVGDFENGL